MNSLDKDGIEPYDVTRGFLAALSVLFGSLGFVGALIVTLFCPTQYVLVCYAVAFLALCAVIYALDQPPFKIVRK